MTEETVYLSLGSNIGDSLEYLLSAVLKLNRMGIRMLATSGVYITLPLGGPQQEDYLNMVAVGCTGLDPWNTLAVCREVEQKLGRVRTVRWGPRTMDIDILLYGQRKIVAPDLEIPHPRMRERAFVLVPLQEAAPEKFTELGLEKDLHHIFEKEADTQKVRLKIPRLDVTMRLKSEGLSLNS